MGKVLSVIVVGLGHQSAEDHLPAIADSEAYSLKAVYDLDPNKTEKFAEKYSVDPIDDLEVYLDIHREVIDVALVAVPHKSYLELIEALAKRNIHIIKEKPFATSAKEAVQLVGLARRYNVSIMMTLQRRFNPVFTAFAQLVKRIGRVHSIEAKYVMDVERLDEGWRASRLFAGGGALIDLGYHYVDLLVWYFDLPHQVICQMSSGNREGQEYDVEDTAFIQFSYDSGDGDKDNKRLGSLVISRTYPSKSEGLTAFGTSGHVSVQRGLVRRVFNGGKDEERLERFGTWPSALTDQLEYCGNSLEQMAGKVQRDYIKHIAFIEACYSSSDSGHPENPHLFYKKLLDDMKLTENDLL